MGIIFALLLFPCFSCAAFIASLIMFLRTPKSDVENRKKNRSSLITSAIVFGVSLAILASLVIFAMLALAHM
ncbi:MAG: hypothetical protein IJX76_07540 [Clostridia bacterium]|nr:hypothetical protein [Clostridia bacterium]